MDNNLIPQSKYFVWKYGRFVFEKYVARHTLVFFDTRKTSNKNQAANYQLTITNHLTIRRLERKKQISCTNYLLYKPLRNYVDKRSVATTGRLLPITCRLKNVAFSRPFYTAWSELCNNLWTRVRDAFTAK